jgi:hypothetical protein
VVFLLTGATTARRHEHVSPGRHWTFVMLIIMPGAETTTHDLLYWSRIWLEWFSHERGRELA